MTDCWDKYNFIRNISTIFYFKVCNETIKNGRKRNFLIKLKEKIKNVKFNLYIFKRDELVPNDDEIFIEQFEDLIRDETKGLDIKEDKEIIGWISNRIN